MLANNLIFYTIKKLLIDKFEVFVFLNYVKNFVSIFNLLY